MGGFLIIRRRRERSSHSNASAPVIYILRKNNGIVYDTIYGAVIFLRGRAVFPCVPKSDNSSGKRIRPAVSRNDYKKCTLGVFPELIQVQKDSENT